MLDRAKPGYWLGPLGALVSLPDLKGSIQPQTTRAGSSRASALGVVKEQQSPRTNRNWNLAIPHMYVREIANLAALVEGEFGQGPFWFVNPWSHVTNLLTAGASMLAEGYWASVSGAWTVGGSYVTDDTGDRVGRTLACPGGGTLRLPTFPRRDGLLPTDLVPVIPTRPVTCSAWLTGVNTDLRMIFRDAYGNLVSTVDSAPVTLPGGRLRRVHVTVPSAPIGAAGVEFRPRNATMIARPAVTWTNGPVDWHVGQGAPRTTISGYDQDVAMAIADPADRRRFADVSFSVREVGL